MSNHSVPYCPLLTPNYQFIEANSSVAGLTGTAYTVRPSDPSSPVLMMLLTWPWASTNRYLDVVVGIELYIGSGWRPMVM